VQAKTKNERLSAESAVAVLKDPRNTAVLMNISEQYRTRIHGNRAYYVHSLNLNPTNICENQCELCAFWREPDDPGAYRVELPEARERLLAAAEMKLTDLHIVGGVTPEFDLGYYEQLLRMCKEVLPTVLVQGLTAVEIHYLAEHNSLSVEDTLQRLKNAGLDAIPGGGAEIFDSGIRSQICSKKIAAETWLAVHETAHGLGMPTNATMLFGHLETPEHIVDHLSRLRDLQDRTHGFQAFIALPFHARGARLAVEHEPSGQTIARTVSLARVFLDNIPHIRLLANYLDNSLLQVLAKCAVDDIGGTSLDERIAKAAGGKDNSGFFSAGDMEDFLRRINLEPVLVNSAYEPADGTLESEAVPPREILATCNGNSIPDDLTKNIESGSRLTPEQAVLLYDNVPFTELGRLANIRRFQQIPAESATFVLDRNISLTNVCVSGCNFCAFYVEPGSPDAFTLSLDEIIDKVSDAVEHGATQIMIQGGLNPALDLRFYEEIFRTIKERFDVWIHSLTATEIVYIAATEGLDVRETLERLIAAGLDSLPGGGAEILVDEIRSRVSPRKIKADQWFDVMRTAHALGIRTTATMVYGLGETTSQRVEHLTRVRDLQDETGGFTAFIPWSFQPGRTRLDMEKSTGVDYLGILALARLFLDNIPHIQSGWVTEGPDLGQLALSFGADDFGGILMEEQVVRSTGVSHAMDLNTAISLINETGLKPVQRTTLYKAVK